MRCMAGWSMGLPPSQISNPCSFIEVRAFPKCRGLTLYCKSRPLWVMTCYNGYPPCGSNHSSDGTVGEEWDKLALGSNYTVLVFLQWWCGLRSLPKTQKVVEKDRTAKKINSHPKQLDPGGASDETVKCKRKSMSQWCSWHVPLPQRPVSHVWQICQRR